MIISLLLFAMKFLPQIIKTETIAEPAASNILISRLTIFSLGHR